MPIYEYACQNCQHTLDALQKVADAPLVECPECGEPQLKRLLSAPRFRLKGEGWYETDFKKDKQRNLVKSDAEAPKPEKAEARPDKPETKPDAKPESKPEKKAEPKAASKSEAGSGS